MYFWHFMLNIILVCLSAVQSALYGCLAQSATHDGWPAWSATHDGCTAQLASHDECSAWLAKHNGYPAWSVMYDGCPLWSVPHDDCPARSVTHDVCLVVSLRTTWETWDLFCYILTLCLGLISLMEHAKESIILSLLPWNLILPFSWFLNGSWFIIPSLLH